MHHKFQKGISSGEVWAGADRYAFREEQCVGEGVRNNSQFRKASCSTSFTGAGMHVKSAWGWLELEICEKQVGRKRHHEHLPVKLCQTRVYEAGLNVVF